ncbi:PP2C family protein-serine/threonine phosphatase [Fodinicola acaciae]|uniref:PP2C family protein-serine/threonine phosphatase n=1 Tax=Fodinicola acaciae TaxID=2681555 RepID=UPI001C9E9FCD|nr:protein phosphatase 2C domain-containing protein [Fodinicola acaciae]
MEIASGTDIGHKYRENYDVLHVDLEPPLIVVADGMGDGDGSRAAGRTTAEVLVPALRAIRTVTPEALRAAVYETAAAVRAAGARIPGLTGCTLAAIVPTGPTAWIVQLGDSRVYRLREGWLELLTVDHTAAWIGLTHGFLRAGAPDTFRASYQLFRYLGHPANPEPDLLAVELRAGDVLLACTDGISDQLTYQQLVDILGTGTCAEIVARLLAAAEAAGGNDNATAAVLRVS